MYMEMDTLLKHEALRFWTALTMLSLTQLALTTFLTSATFHPHPPSESESDVVLQCPRPCVLYQCPPIKPWTVSRQP